ncbi:dihydroorotase [Paenibacillus sp. MMO-177]|uniref:dihydroorotase n=1 Tax=Paenibacillus sp. MMO-177 TaxID=3081289 RepID=UPI003018FBBA
MHDNAYELTVRGNLVLPGEIILPNGILAIRDGSIAALLNDGDEYVSLHHINAEGRYIMPGAIDAHVHCFSEPREGIVGATRSAAAGGVTTIIDMPYDADEPVWTAELFHTKAKRIEREAFVDVALLATIRPTDGLDEIPRLAAAGACGFKLSTFNTNSYRFPRINDGEMLAAFTLIEKEGLTVGLHAENDEIVRWFSALHENGDGSDPLLHCKARPPVAESAAVATALELAYWTGVNVHFHHTTVPHAVRLAAAYSEHGTNVSIETCIHYLILTEDDMLTLGARAKINPPLRTKEAQGLLWDYCRNGEVGLVTSDHAPWRIDRKSSTNIFENASGAPGVETLLPNLYSTGVAEGNISIHDLVRLICENPARVYGLSDRKGSLKHGVDADFVILDPEAVWTLNEAEQHSFAGWSLYHGRVMKGKIEAVYVRGIEVFNGHEVADRPNGRFVKPGHRAYSPLKPLKEEISLANVK